MKKRIIFFSIVIVFIIAYVFKLKSDDNILFDKVFYFEYGEKIEIYEELISNKDISIIDIVYPLEDDEIVDVGSYVMEVMFLYENNERSEVIHIKVEDTLKPIINVEENIRIEQNEKINLSDYLTVVELSEYKLEIPSVDTSEIGSQKVIVSAKDIYENESFKEVEIEVYDKLKPTVVDGILIVNKKHQLPSDYNPGEDIVAQEQILAFIAEMQDLNFDISSLYSGYRSYQFQEEIYNNFKDVYGEEEADKQIARPGYSEHQTGLSFDLKHKDGQLVTKDEEERYIRKNAARFGFIVRYPKDKTSITGYTYEPWHLRYVGEIANHLSENNLTLEEYLNIEGKDYS